MSAFTIYGLRLKGDTEVRYIGLTSHHPDTRLYKLTQEAKCYRSDEAFKRWLRDNEGGIETVGLATALCLGDARVAERAVVSAFLALDHSLFNHWLVPPEKRIDWEPSRFRRAA